MPALSSTHLAQFLPNNTHLFDLIYLFTFSTSLLTLQFNFLLIMPNRNKPVQSMVYNRTTTTTRSAPPPLMAMQTRRPPQTRSRSASRPRPQQRRRVQSAPRQFKSGFQPANLSTGSNPFKAVSRVSNNLGRINPKQNDISARNISNNTFLSYAKCRLDPTMSGEAIGIPDSDATRKIVVDYRTYADVTLPASASAPFYVLTAPLMGNGCVGTRCFNNYTVSNAAYQSTVAGNGALPGTLSGFFPACPAPEWFAWQISAPGLTQKPTPYSSDGSTGMSKARMVSCTTKIYYTGTAMNCAGTLVTSEVVIGSTYTPALNLSAYTTFSLIDGTTTNIAGYLNTVDQINGALTVATYLPDSVANKMEVGVRTDLQHCSGPYQWRSVQPNSTVLLSEYVGNPVSFWAANPSTAYGHNWGTAWYDFDWTSSLTTITNFTPSTTIRIENYVCFEIALEMSSPFYRLAKETQMGDDATVAKIASVARMIPSALPANSSMKKWIDLASRYIMQGAGSVLTIGKAILHSSYRHLIFDQAFPHWFFLPILYQHNKLLYYLHTLSLI